LDSDDASSAVSSHISWTCIHGNERVKLGCKEWGYCSVASVCTQDDKWNGAVKPGTLLSIYEKPFASVSIEVFAKRKEKASFQEADKD
jgi:hypothetical protein